MRPYKYEEKYQSKVAFLSVLCLLLGTLVAILVVRLFVATNEPEELIIPFVKDVEAVETVRETPYSVFRHIETECYIYGISPDYCFCIIQKESNFKANSVGDSGKAVGIAQFWKGTWESMRKQMGASTKDTRISAYDSIQTFAWALSKGYDSHWTASRYCQEFK